MERWLVILLLMQNEQERSLLLVLLRQTRLIKCAKDTLLKSENI